MVFWQLVRMLGTRRSEKNQSIGGSDEQGSTRMEDTVLGTCNAENKASVSIVTRAETEGLIDS